MAVMASLGPAWPDALTPVATSAEQACAAGPSHGDTGARALCLEARWSLLELQRLGSLEGQHGAET